jgi:hypothetical protein
VAFNNLVRTHEFWDAMKARIAGSVSLNNVLGGANRIYRVTDDYDQPEDVTDQKPWGRVVIVPSDTLWPTPDMADQTKTVSWLVRTEFNDFSAVGYDVEVPMDSAMSIVDVLLVGWRPTGFSHILVALPVYRHTSPRALSSWDEGRGVWWKSAEYRTEVSPL